MLYFRDKKEARSIRRPGGYEGARKKEPEQFEGGGEKERVAGVGKGAKKISPINVKAPGTKKRVPGEGVSLLLGHSVIVRR